MTMAFLSQYKFLVDRAKSLKLFLLICSLFLAGCTGYKAPIEAFDFGQPRFSANVMGYNVKYDFGVRSWRQVSEGEATGLVAIGPSDPIIAVAVGHWSPYYGGMGGFNSICRMQTTQFGGGSARELEPEQSGPNAKPNRPCWMSGGEGVYIELDNRLYSGQFPEGVPHIKCRYNMAAFRKDYEEVTGMPSELYKYVSFIQSNKDCPFYKDRYVNLKVQDIFYYDNGGGIYLMDSKGNIVYDDDGVTPRITRNSDANIEVIFLGGVRDPDRKMIQVVVDVFTTRFQLLLRELYNSVVQSVTYETFYYGGLTIFISMTGILSLFGLISLGNKSELIGRASKIAIVTALVNPNSWEFYNRYVVALFIGGIDGAIVLLSSAFVSPSPYGVFGQFDDFISMMFSQPVGGKTLALIMLRPFSFIGLVAFIIIWLISLLLMWQMVKAAVLYIYTWFVTTIVLALGPFIIPTMFFKATSQLYENFIRLLVSGIISMGILFTVIAFFVTTFVEMLQKILYFQATWSPWALIKIGRLTLIEWRFWRPPEGYAVSFVDMISLLFVGLAMSFVLDNVDGLAKGMAGGISLANLYKGAMDRMTGFGNTLLAGGNLIGKKLPGLSGLASFAVRKPVQALANYADVRSGNLIGKKSGFFGERAYAESLARKKLSARGFRSAEIGKIGDGGLLEQEFIKSMRSIGKESDVEKALQPYRDSVLKEKMEAKVESFKQQGYFGKELQDKIASTAQDYASSQGRSIKSMAQASSLINNVSSELSKLEIKDSQRLIADKIDKIENAAPEQQGKQRAELAKMVNDMQKVFKEMDAKSTEEKYSETRLGKVIDSVEENVVKKLSPRSNTLQKMYDKHLDDKERAQLQAEANPDSRRISAFDKFTTNNSALKRALGSELYDKLITQPAEERYLEDIDRKEKFAKQMQERGFEIKQAESEARPDGELTTVSTQQSEATTQERRPDLESAQRSTDADKPKEASEAESEARPDGELTIESPQQIEATTQERPDLESAQRSTDADKPKEASEAESEARPDGELTTGSPQQSEANTQDRPDLEAVKLATDADKPKEASEAESQAKPTEAKREEEAKMQERTEISAQREETNENISRENPQESPQESQIESATRSELELTTESPPQSDIILEEKEITLEMESQSSPEIIVQEEVIVKEAEKLNQEEQDQALNDSEDEAIARDEMTGYSGENSTSGEYDSYDNFFDTTAKEKEDESIDDSMFYAQQASSSNSRDDDEEEEVSAADKTKPMEAPKTIDEQKAVIQKKKEVTKSMKEKMTKDLASIEAQKAELKAALAGLNANSQGGAIAIDKIQAKLKQLDSKASGIKSGMNNFGQQ